MADATTIGSADLETDLKDPAIAVFNLPARQDGLYNSVAIKRYSCLTVTSMFSRET